MKKFLSLLLFACVIPVFASEYADIRAELAKVKAFSKADFDLGDKLLARMKKNGMKKPLLYGKQFFFTEPVLWVTSKMYLTDKLWLDQGFFKSRELYELSPSIYKKPGIAKNLELLRETGMDGYGMFVNIDITKDAVNMLKQYSSEDYPLYCMPTLNPEGAYGPLSRQHLDFLAKHPAVLRWQGKPLFSSYGGDGQSPAEVKKYIDDIEKLAGTDCAYMAFVGSMRGVGTDPYHYYMENKGQVPATIIFRWYDRLFEYLKVADGVKFANRLTHRDMRYNAEYYDKVILPLFSAAVARKEFCGKKLFQFQIMTGYNSFLGNQTLSHDGTKTFRKAYGLAKKYPIDIILQFEWDEANEDTGIQPTLCRPMAYQRIIKYYTDTAKKLPLKPRKGDDLSLPNLIVSQLRQYVPGSDFEVELLNVPDSPEKQEYTVDLELLGHKGKVFWKAENLKFDSTKLQEHNVYVPSAVMAKQRCAVPKLTIKYRNRTRVISEGMPFTVIRATTKNDYICLSTPVRNLMFPVKPDVSIRPTGKKGMVSKFDIAADLNFPGHKLQAVEVVNNSYDIFSYDPKNEYLQSNSDRRNYRFSWQYLNSRNGGPASIWIKQEFDLKGTKSGIFFAPTKEPGRSYLINYSELFRQIPWDSTIFDSKSYAGLNYSTYIFSVKKNEADKAVFHVSGTRLSGPYKDKNYSWSVPLKDLGEYGIKTKVFFDGLQLGVETFYRPERQPLPLMTEKVKFKNSIVSDIPEGIMAVRAIARDGRVWWSKPYAVTDDENKLHEVQVYNRKTGFWQMKVEKNRIPRIIYRFDPERSGDTLVTDAGREYFASLGAHNTISIGFQGQSHSYGSAPQIVLRDLNRDERNNCIAPAWEKLPDGKYGLRFTGKPNAFINLPPGALPHKNGYTMEFDVLPEEVSRDQVYFSMCRGNDVSGFRLRTEKGKFVVDFKHRRPHDNNSSLYPMTTRVSKISPLEGKWNRVRFRYDGRAVYLSVNGSREDVLPFTGITSHLNVASFAGDGSKGSDGKPRYFKGILRSLSIIHTATP